MSENRLHPECAFTSKPSKFQTSSHCRILAVDDDVCIRHIYTEALSQSGYDVDAAEDGDVAWDALQLYDYDLLITDQMMARVCGIELIQKMRAARIAMPVIMATSTIPEAEFTRQPWLQPDAVLLKPYSISELLGVVRRVLYAAEHPSVPIHHLLALAACRT
jgi:DNA-binding response OmpR family regulator